MDDQFYGDAPPTGRSRRKQILITGLIAILVFFVLDDILGLIGGGGLFSVTSALQEVRKHQPLIDVDDAGLRTFFVALCSLAAMGVGLRLNVDLKKRLPSYLFAMAVLGGFVLDGVYGDKIVGHLLAGDGYSRCKARDHSEGHGKGRVTFDDYVLNSNDCPPLPITITPVPATPQPDPRSELPRAAKPTNTPSAWFTADDYPAEALRENQEGVTTARFVIDASGRVTQCDAAVTSGSPSLDATTCAVLVTNGRYWPARDATGKAVAQVGSFRIRWKVPSGDPAG